MLLKLCFLFVVGFALVVVCTTGETFWVEAGFDGLVVVVVDTGVDVVEGVEVVVTVLPRPSAVHSDSLRTERRQRAEEQAAKTTVKMIIPLVLFVMPSLIFVTVGPAVIQLMHIFMPVAGGKK